MDRERFQIGNYARIHGIAATLRKYTSKYPSLKENTFRNFKSKVKKEVKNTKQEGKDVKKSISEYSVATGRPLMLRELDNMVKIYIKALTIRGCTISPNLATATAKVLIPRYPDVVGNIDIDSSSWAKSLFKRMGFVTRVKTSSKVKIPDRARKELKYSPITKL